LIVVGKLLEKSGNYGFNAQTEEYCDMVAAGSSTRPRSCVGAPGRSLGCLAPDHHRSDDRREAKDKAPMACLGGAAWRHGISKKSNSFKMQNPAAMPGFSFCFAALWRPCLR